jgi:glutamine amidotransferase-like uncharacterized protein
MKALVYRGPASLPGCPEAVAELLRQSRWGFDVEFVGPKEHNRLKRSSLESAAVYAQPGGGELAPAYRRMRRASGAIRDFVTSGGRYLGFCLGGYLAGHTPGFGLLPGDTDQYIASPGATIRGEHDAVVEVDWYGQRRQMYFHDGPVFVLDAGSTRPDVVAVYDNGLPAAVVAGYGSGVVGVVGPHPEATTD